MGNNTNKPLTNYNGRLAVLSAIPNHQEGTYKEIVTPDYHSIPVHGKYHNSLKGKIPFSNEEFQFLFSVKQTTFVYGICLLIYDWPIITFPLEIHLVPGMGFGISPSPDKYDKINHITIYSSDENNRTMK